jgi:hypothetical protein
MGIILLLVFLFRLSIESDDLLKLGLYGQILFSGATFLYFPLTDYDQDKVRFSVYFNNGFEYSHFFIYYMQSNDLNISNPIFTKINHSSKHKSKTSYTFYFTIKLYNITDYLIIFVPGFKDDPTTKVTFKHLDYSDDGDGLFNFFAVFICIFVFLVAVFIIVRWMIRRKITSSQIENKGPTFTYGSIYTPQPSYPQQPINSPQPSYPQQPINSPQPSYPQQPINSPQPSYPQQPINMQQPSYPQQPINMQQPSYPQQPINMQQPSYPQQPINMQQPDY